MTLMKTMDVQEVRVSSNAQPTHTFSLLKKALLAPFLLSVLKPQQGQTTQLLFDRHKKTRISGFFVLENEK